MMEVPSDEWAPSNSWDNIPPRSRIPIIANWDLIARCCSSHIYPFSFGTQKLCGSNLEEMINLQEGEWCDVSEKANEYALPTVMKKIFVTCWATPTGFVRWLLHSFTACF